MGLDMFLYRKKYLGYNEKVKVTGVKGIRNDKIKEISEEAIYWRKANMIHKWFVKNIQKNKDECQEYDVSVKQLEELYVLVCYVLRNKKKAKEILPIGDGFFFGNTDYNEHYFDDLEFTAKELKLLLSLDNNGFYFRYSSSW